MSYDKALEAAGAEIILFEMFGSYQGDWWAKVKHNGVIGWVHGSFGSCTGCDAFEAEFGYDDDEDSPDFQKRLVDFGNTYMNPLYTQKQAEEIAEKESYGEQEQIEFIKTNAIK